jgi:hypothetical protein
MPRFSIKDPTVHQRTIKGYTFYEQRAVMEFVSADGQVLRQSCILAREEGEAGYPAGLYSLSDTSFCVGQYEKPALLRSLILVPVPAVKAA